MSREKVEIVRQADGRGESGSHVESVAESDVEAIRRGYEAFNRRDMDAFLGLLDEAIEWREPEGGAQGATHYGRGGVERFLEMALDAWSEYEVQIADIREASERYVVLLRTRAKGKASGLEVEANTAHVIAMRDGKATRLLMYAAWAEALDAVGLRE